MAEWIKYSDKKPDINNLYPVVADEINKLFEFPGWHSAIYEDGKWFIINDDIVEEIEVLYWYDLPNPPEDK